MNFYHRTHAMGAAAKLRTAPGLSLAVVGSAWRTYAVGRVALTPAAVTLTAVLAACLVFAWPTVGVARAATKSPVVLAVWAHVDDDVPVAGATVRVYATSRPPASWRGQPPARLLVAQSSAAPRTYRTGVALLELSRLPAAFTVEVTGGEAQGRRLPGRFSVVVRHYVSGTVVDVNPVTTLITDDIAGQRRSSRLVTATRARAQIYRLLDIPGWTNQFDLRNSTRYLDGARYLQAAGRAGGIGRLDRALVRQARRGQHHRFLARKVTSSQDARLLRPVASAAALPAIGGALVSQAFKFLATQAGSSLASVAGEKAGTAALGWLLAGFGLKDVLEDQNVLEIRRIVDQLSKQVAQLNEQVGQLRNDVGVVGFSTLVHQTDSAIGQIEHATGQLALLSNLPAKDPTRAAFAQTIVDFIGAKLLDAPAILNRGLGSHLPLADNVIKAASRALGQRKFFGPQRSAEVRGVYDYFAAYQVQLAMLLQEYYHAKPTIYSPDNNAANLAQLHRNVESQAAALKPDVPVNTVIDTRSREMWVTDLPDPKKRLFDIAKLGHIPYVEYGEKFEWRTGEKLGQCGAQPVDGPTGVRGVPYCNWELPNEEAYRRLIDGWSGKSPASWLTNVGGFNAAFIQASGHVKWVRQKHYPLRITGFLGIDNELSTTQFDLSNNTFFSPKPVWRIHVPASWKAAFEHVYAGLMYVRKLTPDESYWWSS